MGIIRDDDNAVVCHGDAIEVLRHLLDNSIDAVVTDPPYNLAFMGKDWDRHVTPLQFQQWCQLWAVECLRVLKPGGYMLVFGGTRTFHRLACAIEDTGFEIRDTVSWLYGSGFPKSLDVSKAIDKAARGVPQGGIDPTSANHGKYRTQKTEGKRHETDQGRGYGAGASRFLVDGQDAHETTERELVPEAQQWQGWGTALKPAWEPIIVARKPLSGTVAENAQQWGTGAINVDACRVGNGRWPPNVMLDESQAKMLDLDSGTLTSGKRTIGIEREKRSDTRDWRFTDGAVAYGDTGGASRFFPTFKYQAKAPRKERPTSEKEDGTKVAHPTCKPLELMRWLVRLVTPLDGWVLDPFAGSGTTGEAALLEGMKCILIEREEEYLPLITQRLDR